MAVEHFCVRRLSHVSTTWLMLIRFAIAVPTLTLGAVYVNASLPNVADIAIIVAVLVPLEAAIGWLQISAIQRGQQSTIGPLYGLSVVFVVLFEWGVVGELPSFSGLASIIAVVGGSLMVAGPNLFSVSGSAVSRMTGAAICGALAVTLTRWLLVSGVPPLVVAAMSYAGAAVVSIPRSVVVGRPNNWAWLFGLGCAFTGVAVFHFYGLSLAPASYVVAAKRSSIAWDVVLGWASREKLDRWQITGAAIILGGCMAFYAV